ncbi:MAG: cell wall hydrolase [Verrucomicrobiota bacterium]|nr:cell wall hydrolase [Verrucomicrobiota bacterium]
MAQPVYDEEIVATTLILEAGGEGIVGMQAVLNVIDNRVKTRGISRVAVVQQPKQMSSLNSITKHPRHLQNWSGVVSKAKQHDAWSLALALVQCDEVPDLTDGAIYFFSGGLLPKWARPNTIQLTAIIGGHKFYRN